MAYATPSFTGLHSGTGIVAFLRATRAAIADSRKHDRAYRKTFRELEQMTDKDLADIGITRFMIGDIAAEAAARA